MIIAVDGPAASGKGTLAKGLARHYGLPHLDTGLLYRAVGHGRCGNTSMDPDFDAHAIAAAQSLDYDDLDAEILAGPGMGPLASKVSTISGVREALYEFQREFATRPDGAVLDGRDIGTKIAPDADVKLFIQADSRRRAERRGRQFERRGEAVDLEAIQASIEARDARDRENPYGGFYPAGDAHLLDTTELSIEAALRAAVAIIDGVLARKGRGSGPNSTPCAVRALRRLGTRTCFHHQSMSARVPGCPLLRRSRVPCPNPTTAAPENVFGSATDCTERRLRSAPHGQLHRQRRR